MSKKRRYYLRKDEKLRYQAGMLSGAGTLGAASALAARHGWKNDSKKTKAAKVIGTGLMTAAGGLLGAIDAYQADEGTSVTARSLSLATPAALMSPVYAGSTASQVAIRSSYKPMSEVLKDEAKGMAIAGATLGSIPVTSEILYQGMKKLSSKIKRSDRKNKKYMVVVDGKKVHFGDPNMEIKRDNDDRRQAFLSRHNCDDPGPKNKARYWACKSWRKGTKLP